MRLRKRRLLRALTGIGCLLASVRPVWAAQPQIAVITAAGGPHLTLDRTTLRNIYLKKVFIDDDHQRLNPVNLPTGSPLRNAFVQAVIRMPDPQLQDYWDREYFQGVSPPYVLGSQDAVVRFVAVTPGAVGYVALCHVDASVHVAMLIPLPPNAAADISECRDRSGP
jgi:ABC-type phosphate transport system substrate-binding protein